MIGKWLGRFVIIAIVLICSLDADIQAQRKLVLMPVSIGVTRHTKEPFTATEFTTWVQPAGDGTTVTRTAVDEIARDSKGRVYSEEHLPWTEDPSTPIYYIGIIDPVAKQRISLDPQRNIAVKGHWEDIYARDYSPYDNLSLHATHAGESVKAEKLGKQEIAGLECWGVRMTHVVPPAMYGNPQELMIIDEFWYSDKLGIDVKRHRNDPRSGDQVSELRNVVRTEPPQGMFQVPPSYVVEPLPKSPN